MMTSNCSLTSSRTRPLRARFLSGLPVPELHPVPALGRQAQDVVVRAADGAGAALDAVAEADDGLPLLLVPLVDAGGAEVGAVLARAAVAADGLVADLDVPVPGVLDVAIGEELVGQLLHLNAQSTEAAIRAVRTIRLEESGSSRRG